MHNRFVYFSLIVLVLFGIFLGYVAAAHATEGKAQTFMITEAEAVIKKALIERGLDKDITLEQVQIVPSGSRGGVSVERAVQLGINFPLVLEDVVLEENITRFTATLRKFEDASQPLPEDALVRPSLPVAAIEVRGRYTEMAEVPALIKRLRKGEVITKNDIEYITVSKNRIRSSTVTEESQIVGKAMRRSVNAGEVIRISDVEAPRLVERGKLIAIFYRTGGMELKDMGYAMEDGSKGDIIPVKNARSNAVVQAMVSGQSAALVNYWQQAAN